MMKFIDKESNQIKQGFSLKPMTGEPLAFGFWNASIINTT